MGKRNANKSPLGCSVFRKNRADFRTACQTFSRGFPEETTGCPDVATGPPRLSGWGHPGRPDGATPTPADVRSLGEAGAVSRGVQPPVPTSDDRSNSPQPGPAHPQLTGGPFHQHLPIAQRTPPNSAGGLAVGVRFFETAAVHDVVGVNTGPKGRGGGLPAAFPPAPFS
jgi:hypothetical protein